jgi:hypothetical protein
MALGAILAPYIVGPPLAGGLRAAGLRHRGRLAYAVVGLQHRLACGRLACAVVGLRAAGLQHRRWPALWSACGRLACNTAGGWPAGGWPTLWSACNTPLAYAVVGLQHRRWPALWSAWAVVGLGCGRPATPAGLQHRGRLASRPQADHSVGLRADLSVSRFGNGLLQMAIGEDVME